MANPRARLELSPEMSIRVRGEVQFVRLVLIVNIANELKLIGALPRPRSSFNGPRALSLRPAHPWLLHPPLYPGRFLSSPSLPSSPLPPSFLVLSLSGRRTAINPVVVGVRDY